MHQYELKPKKCNNAFLLHCFIQDIIFRKHMHTYILYNIHIYSTYKIQSKNVVCCKKIVSHPSLFCCQSFYLPFLLNQPTNSRFQPKPPIVLIAPVQASLSLTSESISEVTGKKKRGVLVGKKFQKSTICSIFDICISHLKFFLFGKKNILFKSTFVKRRGIFDHSSQDGILWHAKKVTNIINCIRFVASTFCITQG